MRVSAIIYGEESGIVRRMVFSDALDELAAATAPAKGEAVYILDPKEIERDGLPDLYKAISLVEQARGKPADIGRVLVLDDLTGEIEGVLAADPIVDRLPGKTLFQHPKAEKGWVLDERGEYQHPDGEVKDDPREVSAIDAGVR